MPTTSKDTETQAGGLTQRLIPWCDSAGIETVVRQDTALVSPGRPSTHKTQALTGGKRLAQH